MRTVDLRGPGLWDLVKSLGLLRHNGKQLGGDLVGFVLYEVMLTSHGYIGWLTDSENFRDHALPETCPQQPTENAYFSKEIIWSFYTNRKKILLFIRRYLQLS